MTELQHATDDELQAEAQRRVDRGDRSPDVYMTRQQHDHRAQVGHLRAAIISAWCGNPADPVLDALRLLCDRLDTISGNPMTEQAHGINTTFYGKLAEQDHRPKGETQ